MQQPPATSSADSMERPQFATTIREQLLFFFEALLVACCFYLFTCGPVPDVNEAHYWTKAKQFWDPSFAPGDRFLESADAHWTFYWTLGQFTRWLPLESATWVGRWCVWLAMALGWVSLSRVFAPRFGAAIVTAALLVVATRWGHLSGEWVVGGAEAKGLAFGCFFFAAGQACQGKWAQAYVAAGVAAAFHVLVGGWLVVCLMFAGTGSLWAAWHGGRLSTDTAWPAVRKTLTGMFVGGSCSLFGLIPGLALNWNVSPAVAEQASFIYVLFRLPHHLVFTSFHPIQLLAFCGLLVTWLFIRAVWTQDGQTMLTSDPTLFRQQRLLRIVDAALLLAACGVLLSWSLSEYGFQPRVVSLLRYYWFRTSDVLLPMGCILLGWAVVSRWISTSRSIYESVRHLSVVVLVCGLAIGMEFLNVWNKSLVDSRPLADQAALPNDPNPERTRAIQQNWVRVCRWVRNNTSPDAMFLTPRMQHTFKWYAHRPEVVNWKDVPQDSASLVEWWQRVQDCSVFWTSDYRLAIQEPVMIHELVEKYQVDYIVMSQYAHDLQVRFGNPLPYRVVYPESPDQKTTFVVLATFPANAVK